MKIAIIGATGMAGSAIYKEAIARGHEVTAIVRHAERAAELLGKDATVLQKDAFTLTKEDLTPFDVVIKAFSAPPEKAYLHIDLSAKLIAMLRETSRPRLFFILGAGSLLDENNKPFIETIRTWPGAESWISIPESQAKELTFLQLIDNVNWVGVSPSADFHAGEATTPVLGKDHLLTAKDGQSHTTSGTMAKAVLNEIETPSVFNARFTVSD